MTRGLQCLPYEDRVRELGYSAWRRFQADFRAAFQYLKRAYRKDGERLFKECSNGMRGNDFTLKESRFKFTSVSD